MRSTVTDRLAWSVGRSVGLSVTLVSFAKTADMTDMPFGLRTRVGAGNHILDGGPDPPMGRSNFGQRGAHYKVSAVSCAKTAEAIDVPFGLWT